MIREYKNTGYFSTPYGDIYRKKKYGFIKINPCENNKYGHKQVEIYNGSGVKFRVYLHRLIYETWIGSIRDGFEIDHIDFNPKNNNVLNLRQITISENRSRKKNPISRTNPISKVLSSEVISIILENKNSNKAKLSRELGISRNSIYYILKRFN